MRWRAILFMLCWTSTVWAETGNFYIQDTTNDVHKVTLVDSEIPFSHTSFGVHAHARGVTNTILEYGRDDDTYQLTNSQVNHADSCSCNPPIGAICTCTAVTYISHAGDLDGVDMNNETMTLRFRANMSGKGIMRNSKCVGEVFHRDANDVDTSLGTITQAITSTATNYERTLTVDQDWGANEKLKIVWKFEFTSAVQKF